MLNLFLIASANPPAIEEAFEAAVTAMSPEQANSLREFAAWVDTDARISISVKLFVIGDLLNGRAYQNKHEWAHEQVGHSGRTPDEILRENLGSYYEKRIAFDNAFNDGVRFRYGALNAGNLGLTKYGQCCIVLTRAFEESLAEVAYLPGDSLEICLREDAGLDENAVRKLPAPRSHRHVMVAVQRATEVPPVGKREWPGLVASDSRYFEAVFIGDVSLATVEYVCMSKSENDRQWELAFANFGRKLSDAERALAHDFVVLRRGVSEGRIQLKVIT
jgi:hypothetical protein